MKFLVTAAAFALLASPALAGGQIPDGTYDCMMDDGIGNGSMVIQGNTYMGPNYDGQYEGRYTFSVGGGGDIRFNGPLGLYAGLQVIGARLVDDGNGNPAIEIQVKDSASDNIHITDCTIE